MKEDSGSSFCSVFPVGSVETEMWCLSHWCDMERRSSFPHSCLRKFLRIGPGYWKAEAARKILEQDFSEEDLECIISFAPQLWKERAQFVLQTMKGTTHETEEG